jgi:hypothetical protein
MFIATTLQPHCSLNKNQHNAMPSTTCSGLRHTTLVVSTASNRSTQKRAISDTDKHNKTQPKKKKAAESEEDGDEENPAATKHKADRQGEW